MAESFDLSAPWLPTRHFELSISTQDEDDLGGAQACKVYLVHKDEWPCADAGKMSEDRIWNIYLYKTVVGNWYQEMWYFIGVMIRAIHINVANPFLKMYMVGSIIERFRMEEALLCATCKLICLAAHHYTEYWESACNDMIAQLTLPEDQSWFVQLGLQGRSGVRGGDPTAASAHPRPA